jgi:hypothetical protein
MSIEGSPAPLRCAQWARAEAVDPIGSIGSYASYLMIETPLPWESDLGEMAQFGALNPTLAAKNCRLQALAPVSNRSTLRHVMLYVREEIGSFVRYVGREELVQEENVVECALRMLNEIDAPTSAALIGRDVVDVLVCTHGRRDVCCGSLGTRLAKAIEELKFEQMSVRIWRTSHTGGHRFAPTMLVFPEGTAWAYLDSETAVKIIERHDEPSIILGHYRGCCGLDSPRVQAAERSVLAEVGWELFGLPRWGVEKANGAVRFNVQFYDYVASWEATVQETRRLPTPKCGAALDASSKASPEYAVVELRRLS